MKLGAARVPPSEVWVGPRQLASLASVDHNPLPQLSISRRMGTRVIRVCVTVACSMGWVGTYE